MAVRACAVALWCALAVAGAAAYTVDCNHEYTDCDTELSELTASRGKIGAEDDEVPSTLPPAETTSADPSLQPSFLPTLPPQKPTTEPQKREVDATPKVEATEAADAPETPKQPRLLNLNVDELQNFANALHNETKQQKSQKVDLSDVNMDEDEDDPPRLMPHDHNKHEKQIPEKFYSNLQVPFSPLLTIDRASEETDTCKENEVFYKIGDRIDRGCEETCECSPGGTFDCTPRCKHPYIRRGRRLSDPLCFESPVDECCSIVACATGNQELKVNKVEVCRYNNDTHAVGTKWHIGCEQTCSCEPNSVVTCKPRCNKLQPSDKCINVQDPNDECCEVQVCDVSQDVHEEPENTTSSTTSTTSTTESIKGFEDYSDLVHHVGQHDNPKPNPGFLPLAPKEPIGSVKVLQNNSVQVNLMQMNSSENPIYLLLSSDGGKNFEDVELKYSNLILDLPGGRDYILKTKETGTKFNFTITASSDKTDNDTMLVPEDKPGCYQDGKFYDIGEEFHIGCTELCECTGHHQRECVELQCPSHVGLELVSKGCVRWAPSPPPIPPNCCPRAARCLSDGTCHYKGFDVPNWTEVPISLTGCEQRCFCENGELDCQEVCSPLPPLPPQTLRCPPLHRPGPVNISDEDCCKQWGCIPNGQTPSPDAVNTNRPPAFLPTVPPEIHFPTDDLPDYDQNNLHRPVNSRDPTLTALPPGLTIPPNYGEENKKLTVLSLQADSPTSVKLLFGLPPVLVGLRGSVDLRYTDKADEDVSNWYSQVFAPADEVLTTPRLEFRLTGLKPSSTYKIKGKLFLHNLPVEPESQVYSVRTLDLPTVPPMEEKRRTIDCRLSVVDVNDTAAHVSWRHFTEEELQFIDGVQVRYRPVGTPIYSMTELLHHSRSIAELHELRPGTQYEASMILVPPPRATTELHDPGRVEFTTSPFVDPYNWSVTIEARVVGSDAAELTWHGVPSPGERWVRVYRAAHACGSTRHEHDAFRLAARDLPPTILLNGLESSTRCRVWLELFLTNGKIKTSNVLEINTKSQDSPEEIDNEIEASSIADSRGAGRGDYYGALVVVGVVAALGALTSLLLLLVLVRRHRPRSVPITPVPTAPRESSLPPYDNPAYKLELQQETMDL
ncbi:putative epidermal cell surface receptor isoform X2 [Pectinophora gossypiella]|uniref:putative epidermal cell surface receptor isoform X2 n=1 Tax=Pectinophora gossypiella TaxID=13191 RepID=UPI00214F34FE|nr:putative epidermal cell surface receptor isoform X2 [Pectinophora gossypiella]